MHTSSVDGVGQKWDSQPSALDRQQSTVSGLLKAFGFARVAMRSRNSPNWQVVPEDEWTIDASIGSSRRIALLDGRGFDRILSDVLGSLEIVSIRYKPMENGEPEKRAVVTIRTCPEAVDQFHNSSSGYRAQFYVAPALGENANRNAVEALSERVLVLARNSELLSKALKNPVATSLSQPQAKVWIHQGSWFRQRRRVDRVLRVYRWQLNLTSPCKHVSNLALWASLAPSTETQIVLKGGFLSPSGEPIPEKGKPQNDRSNQLHSTGFT
ncbi:hypothetical protein [Paraburkholderia sp. GAS348]|uniref:hypothetical protein n=1 Tax=Paraburkholderia sp. GAS348 TaxID=3035132 RepID=UPI003D25BB1F